MDDFGIAHLISQSFDLGLKKLVWLKKCIQVSAQPGKLSFVNIWRGPLKINSNKKIEIKLRFRIPTASAKKNIQIFNG